MVGVSTYSENRRATCQVLIFRLEERDQEEGQVESLSKRLLHSPKCHSTQFCVTKLSDCTPIEVLTCANLALFGINPTRRFSTHPCDVSKYVVDWKSDICKLRRVRVRVSCRLSGKIRPGKLVH